MATSGSVNLGTTGAELCLTANQILAHYGGNKTTLSNVDSAFALKILNWFMKHTQVNGGFLWKKSVAYLFTPAGQLTYNLSSAGDHCTETYQTTTLTAAAVSSDLALTVDDTTGMTTGDAILIPLADGTYQSTTITVSSSTSLTIGTGVSEDLSSGVRIFTYTTKVDKPMRVTAAARRQYNTDGTFSDVDIDIESFDYYQTKVTDKTASSMQLSVVYLPLRTTGKLYLRGSNTDGTRILLITIQRQIEDLNATSDEPDYPSEWFLALAFKLAYYLSFRLDFDKDTRAEIRAEADRIFNETLKNDMESAAIKIGMGNR